MKKHVLILFIFCSGFSEAQNPGEWVWLKGDSIANNLGNFGTQGIPSPTNEPPGLYEACEWTDLNGDFWLFGGLGSTSIRYATLWKYETLTNEWVWMNGSQGFSLGNYGIQGVSSLTNQPPAREHGVNTWTDIQGNLWMFGGYNGTGLFSDLWKYNISTNEWTWMKGPSIQNNLGIYGILGVSSPLNNPSCRNETASSWTDNNGDLWMFGGADFGGQKNDLWRYNTATNEWTWLKGAQGVAQPSVYGTVGVEDPINTPGGRSTYTHWKDSIGNLWLFSGEDFISVNTFNDMWRYNPITNNWAWMSGSNTPGEMAFYGTRCTYWDDFNPGKRYENRAGWNDLAGNFWTFGGNINWLNAGFKNDLWKYCTATNVWTWVSGDTISNPTGSWGNLGVSSPTSKPCGRAGSVGWRSLTGELYLFGGCSNPWSGMINDLWKYTIDTTCGFCSNMPLASYTSSNNLCPGTCAHFINLSFNATSYQWSFPGASPDTSTDINPQNICYANSGSFDVQLIASNANGIDTLLLTNYINVYPTPPPQSITQSGDTLFAISGATSYQWYFNTNIINGATDYFYVAPSSGDYNVVATDGNECEVEAAVFNVVAGLQSTVDSQQLTIFPNPVENKITIHKAQVTRGTAVEISINNMIGELVLREKQELRIKYQDVEIDVSRIPPGIYWIELESGAEIFRTKFVKE